MRVLAVLSRALREEAHLAVPEMISLVQDPSEISEVKIMAASLLSGVATDASSVRLAFGKAMKDPDPKVRSVASDSYGQFVTRLERQADEKVLRRIKNAVAARTNSLRDPLGPAPLNRLDVGLSLGGDPKKVVSP